MFRAIRRLLFVVVATGTRLDALRLELPPFAGVAIRLGPRPFADLTSVRTYVRDERWKPIRPLQACARDRQRGARHRRGARAAADRPGGRAADLPGAALRRPGSLRACGREMARALRARGASGHDRRPTTG